MEFNAILFLIIFLIVNLFFYLIEKNKSLFIYFLILLVFFLFFIFKNHENSNDKSLKTKNDKIILSFSEKNVNVLKENTINKKDDGKKWLLFLFLGVLAVFFFDL